MDALTLTPAWGGGGAGPPDGGGGSGGESLKGTQAAGKPGGVGVGVGGGASTSSSGGGAVRMAYWEKARKRRTMSAQLVFPVQPPENTENIDQPDPSLCGELGAPFLASSRLVSLTATAVAPSEKSQESGGGGHAILGVKTFEECIACK